MAPRPDPRPARGIVVAASGNPLVAELLRSHPHVGEVLMDPAVTGCRFGTREVHVGNSAAMVYGLVELIDNNPLVCADSMSLPSLPVSAALICLGPLMLAGIVQEAPVLVTNARFDDSELDSALRRLGWSEGVTSKTEEFMIPNVIVASGSAVIATPSDPEDLADLYDERFGRSLLIDGDVSKEFSPELVRGRPVCAYRISLTGDAHSSLVTVRAICDASGAYQAAQIVNAMNIMEGWPDSLGLGL